MPVALAVFARMNRAVLLPLAMVFSACTCHPAPAPRGESSSASPLSASPPPLTPPSHSARDKTTAAPSAGALPCPEAPGAPTRAELGPGLVVERHRPAVAPARPAASPCFTLVRADPRRYPLRLLAARTVGGGRRPLPKWAAEFGLIGLVNASMYREDDHSTGLLVASGQAMTEIDNREMSGYLAFDPVRPEDPPVVVGGRACPGFDLDVLRSRYRSVVQNYRLLDCDAKPIAWKDEKVYSAAALGIDGAGNIVFVASRPPHRMADFAAMLVAPEVGLRAALYVEGGPEVSLYVQAGGRTFEEIGSYESGFQEDDGNRAFWPIPNVVGFGPG